MSRVYAVQNTMTHDGRGGLVAKFDLSPAQKFGDLQFLLGPSASPFNPETVILQLHDQLQHYTDEDYLLMVGNPILIGWATSIAAHHNSGYVRCLQWSGTARGYTCVEAALWHRLREEPVAATMLSKKRRQQS